MTQRKVRGISTRASRVARSDPWAQDPTRSARFKLATTAGLLPLRLDDEALGVVAPTSASLGIWGKLARWDVRSDRPTQQPDYFRYVDTRLRRFEPDSGGSSRVPLTGARRLLKDTLDRVGRISTVYPFIADDGFGGAFAEWKVGPQRIEVAVDDELAGHVSVSEGGDTEWFLEFDAVEGMHFDDRQRLRQLLDKHSALVSRLNPHWLRVFVG